jgi:hypothetical protein
MDVNTKPTRIGGEPRSYFRGGPDDVVELSFLVPVRRAETLLALAKRRDQTLAQLLRDLIDRELAVAAGS